MKLYRKRPVLIQAKQWFVHGDVQEVTYAPLSQKMGEGRRKRVGWLDTPQGGHVVFPGDWVVLTERGEMTTINPLTFSKLYEEVESKILPFPGDRSKAM
jgi:hypothetical protein